jgi:hypothetical protein
VRVSRFGSAGRWELPAGRGGIDCALQRREAEQRSEISESAVNLRCCCASCHSYRNGTASRNSLRNEQDDNINNSLDILSLDVGRGLLGRRRQPVCEEPQFIKNSRFAERTTFSAVGAALPENGPVSVSVVAGGGRGLSGISRFRRSVRTSPALRTSPASGCPWVVDLPAVATL